jgi:hypothetical protein
MANENTRLSTAELRRRLLSPSPTPPEPDIDSPPATPAPAPRSLLASRLVVPPTFADAPVAEDEPTYPIHDLAGGDSAPVEATPVPFNRSTPTDLRRPGGRTSLSIPRPAVPQSGSASGGPDPAIDQLRRETDYYRREAESLQQLMEEMRQLLQEASEQEQRVQAELADRDLKIEAAEAKVKELEAAVNAKPKTKTELEEWADDLERESMQIAQQRRTMEEDRKQLRDDEAALEKQMREMEVGMARERALLARQEQELKRLNAEIQHELEIMQRGDGALRERLALFQRRHAEVVSGEGPPPTHAGNSYAGFAMSPVAQVAGAPPAAKKSDTGLLRKFFRGGGE